MIVINMTYRVSASFGAARITTKKQFATKAKAQKLADYINRRKPGANARVVMG